MLESLLCSLAFINIRSRNIPAHNLSMFVAHRIKTTQNPAITPNRCLHPQLQLERGATGASTIGITARRPFSVIRMNEPTGARNPSGCLPPLFKTKADVIERNAVGIKTFAAGSEYSNKLRNEVDYLTELHFTSAPLYLGSFARSDVDHSAHKFKEMAGRAQNRMTDAVNVPDGATRMHNAIIHFFVELFMLGPVGRFPERRLIVGMNSLDEFFGSGQTIPWIKTQNAVAFFRPMPDVAVGTPAPTAPVSHPLRFRHVRFTPPERFPCPLPPSHPAPPPPNL